MMGDLAFLAQLPRDLPGPLAVFSLVSAFVFGSLWGSFLNVVIARVPLRQSVVSPRSRCPSCGTQIAARDNVPILSWVLLRAKCRHCGARISPRYPFVEFLGGLAGAAVVARFGWSLGALELFVFTLTLVAISFIDLDWFIVPGETFVALLVSGLGLGAARAWLVGPDVVGGLSWTAYGDRVIGGVGAGLMLGAIIVVSTAFIRRFFPQRLPAGEDAMGWGDPQILIGIGVHVGWQLVPLVLFVASFVGAVVGLAAKFSGRLKNRAPIELPGEEPWTPPDDAVPFGPFLAVGGLVAAFFGDALLQQLLPILGLGPDGALLPGLFGSPP
jgi:leader peptidase (prepilin peptidase)/N-methyltransferase